MNSFRPFALVFFVAGAAIGAALPAEAQLQQPPSPRPERPYRGLFGGDLGATEQSLILNASAGGGYDDNIFIDQPGSIGAGDPRFAKSGVVGTFNGSLSYTLDKSRVSFGLGASTATRYYPGQDTQEFVSGQNANAHAAFKLSRRSSLQVFQSIGYQPYSFLSILPPVFEPLNGQPLPQEPVIGTLSTPYLAWDRYLTSQTGVSFQQELSRRVSMSLAYDTTYSGTPYPGSSDLLTRYGRGGLRFALTKNLGLRLGYGYTSARYSADRHSNVSNIDAGIDYNRALSFSRRTTFSFNTGSTIISDGLGNDQFQAVGAARLNHEMGRTWNVWGSYDRQFSFIDALLTPALTDSFGAGINGLFNRRVQWQANVRAVIGTLSTYQQAFDTNQATTSLQVALTRKLSWVSSYSYYHYRYDQGVILPPGVAHNIDRQSVQTSISVWAPLFSRSRRSNAAR